MFKKLNWRIVALIALVIAAGGFIYWNVSTVQQLKQELTQEAEQLEQEKKPVVANEPPPAAPGKKWVPHGDHWHEVPIDAPDVWPDRPIARPAPVKQRHTEPPTYAGPLTFHKELLETNPLEALYQQAIERDHWSAKWIPPFPPDDQEAATFARRIYLIHYYKSTGQTDIPEYERLRDEYSSQSLAIMDNYDVSAYKSDLLRLIYTRLHEGDVVLGFRPSNYSLPRK